MKIFGLIIKTEEQEAEDEATSYVNGYTQGSNNYLHHTRPYIRNELLRLKEEHWDKDAFDNLIRILDKTVENK